ncbi:MAG: helix-turn-helix domain-containing protein [Luteitalea sp.]|nr:helix-turn-helix domain-containing protein [Luteitalea sp.]
MERATLLIRRLGRLVRASRDELGLTQAQMAARCGLSVKHFGQLERGDAEASLTALDCLARGLRVSLPDMLGLIAPPRAGDRPTLDLREWLRVQETLHLLTDHADHVVSHAKAFGAESGGASSAHRRRPGASRKRPSRSPKRR